MASAKMTKTQFIQSMAERSGLDKRQVNAVFEALSALVKDQLGDGGPGELTIPNLVKLKAKSTPATQDREGLDPFTKEKKVFKGKPASRKVRATPVKALKDLVGG
jgi:nucleoid DNA-binding protein